ncbi:hypothetical protein [Brevundimonas faecalis]|uniref:Uncharacterized protein n=1 Tax=Brevundimonas faecalis TaxID=947378 RepID=A0ABV2R869_9CAUL
MSDEENRALDRHEAELVGRSREPATQTDRQLAELIRLLRGRRDRIQRMIRTRVRKAGGAPDPDTGAREKKAVLTEAVQRVAAEIRRRQATSRLSEAVRRRAERPAWTGPEDFTPHKPPAETPNAKIAPSGALHAEGMRPAIGRATGDR